MLKAILAFLLAVLAGAAFAATDVNKATQAELEAVKGVGPVMSTKIIAERQKAPFKDWSDLIGRVQGIGAKSATKLSNNGLTVGAQPYAGTSGPNGGTNATTAQPASSGASASTRKKAH